MVSIKNSFRFFGKLSVKILKKRHVEVLKEDISFFIAWSLRQKWSLLTFFLIFSFSCQCLTTAWKHLGLLKVTHLTGRRVELMALWQQQQLQPHLSYTLVLLRLQLGMCARCGPLKSSCREPKGNYLRNLFFSAGCWINRGMEVWEYLKYFPF